MKFNKSLFVIAFSLILTLALVAVSYGYWTDKLTITGESEFRLTLPVVVDTTDVDITKEKSSAKVEVVPPEDMPAIEEITGEIENNEIIIDTDQNAD